MGASIALAESGANVTLVSRTEKELKDTIKKKLISPPKQKILHEKIGPEFLEFL